MTFTSAEIRLRDILHTGETIESLTHKQIMEVIFATAFDGSLVPFLTFLLGNGGWILVVLFAVFCLTQQFSQARQTSRR